MVNDNVRDNHGWLDWAYKGVDHSFIGNGGPECRDFLSTNQKWLESVTACSIAVIAFVYSWPRMRLPESCPCVYRKQHEPLGKRFLLLLMSLTFGIELGFKFATQQMIWVANPCHIVTMMQIFLLVAPPGRIVTTIFRLHMHMLTGAPMAIFFPVINTRLLPFETSVYFVQHSLMLVIPLYLLRAGDPFIPEALGDFTWALTSVGSLFIYHFVPLQLLAYVSHINLSTILCPAVSDPFYGQFYRAFGIGHQLVLVLLFGKILVIIARVLQIMPYNNSLDVANVCSCRPNCFCHSTVCCLPCRNKELCPASRTTDHGSDYDDGSASTFNRFCENSGRSFHLDCCRCGGDCNPSCSKMHSSRSCSSNSR